MKKNKYFEIVEQFGKANVYITLLVSIIIIAMSVSYAEFADLISMIGSVTIEVPNEKLTKRIEFTSYEVLNSDNNEEITIDTKEISEGFNVITKIKSNILANSKFQIRYTLYNGTASNYTYFGSDAVLNDEKVLYPEIYGLSKGEVVKPGETRDILVIFTNTSASNYEIESEIVFTLKKGIEDIIKPIIMGNIINNNILMNDENVASISMNITNLYDCSKELEISVLDPDVVIISDKSKLINKDATDEVNFTLKLNRDYHEPLITSVIVTTKDKESYNIGNITLYKD